MNEHERPILETIAANLGRIADALEQKQNEKGPRLRRQLAAYRNFNWQSIGARIVAKDQHGATIVQSRERIWKRYTHTSYGSDIWFSHGTGKDQQGKNIFIRLITFVAKKDHATVEPLPAKVTASLNARPKPTTRGKNKLFKTTPTPLQANAPAISTPVPAISTPTESLLNKSFPRPETTHAIAQAEQEPVPDNPNDARRELYKLMPNLIQAETLTAQRANELMKLANLEGWKTALQTMRGDVARNAAGQE